MYFSASTSLSSSLRESLVSLLGDQERCCKIKKMKIYSYKSLISGSNRNYQLPLSWWHSLNRFFFLIITFLWVSPSQRDATRNNISHCISMSIASFSSGLVLALRSIPAICSKIVYRFEIKVITGSFWLRQSVPVIMELSDKECHKSSRHRYSKCEWRYPVDESKYVGPSLKKSG